LYKEDSHQRLTTTTPSPPFRRDAIILSPCPRVPQTLPATAGPAAMYVPSLPPMDACLGFFPTGWVSHPRFVTMPSSSVLRLLPPCPSDTVWSVLGLLRRRSNTSNSWPSSKCQQQQQSALGMPHTMGTPISMQQQLEKLLGAEHTAGAHFIQRQFVPTCDTHSNRFSPVVPNADSS